ncbi:HlyC/CorC family transporter [uncultured Thiodictyon sp.]|uniref:HlyC/CorC family transporter n=1 Tax=uncultured Thiodictyon sp. TaxID=1846217 RepID=UPI0025D31FDF|nr:HlyC/CorC family transporter [uncultured Thiodictyon sp.]
MNDIPLTGLVIALAILILLSAFFSGSETALFTLNRYRLRHQADQGHRGARLARILLERPDRLIGLILLGNNFVNILASSIATIIALRLGGEAAIGIAAGVLTFIVLIFGEVTPKTLATLSPERMAYPAAYVYTPLLKVLYPVVWLVNLLANGLLRLMGVARGTGPGTALSREELRTVVSEAGALIPERSRSMLLAILDLERATVEDIMIPRNEVEGIDIQDDAEEIIAAIRNAGYTRLPLFDGGIDNLIGVFHSRNALHALLDEGLGKEHLRAIARPPYFVPAGTPLYQQLLNFQREKQRIALVVDEYGDFLGLITLVDLLEEIVGEFSSDPSDSLTEIHRADDGSLLVDCGIAVRDLNRALRWELPTDGPKTLNGLILEYLETIPEPDTSLMLHGHHMEIIQTTENTVKTVKLPPRSTRKGWRPERRG